MTPEEQAAYQRGWDDAMKSIAPVAREILDRVRNVEKLNVEVGKSLDAARSALYPEPWWKWW